MPRAVWTGALSVGLITAPVRAFPAYSPHAVKFTTHDPRDGAPIGTRRYNKATGQDLPDGVEPEKHAVAPSGVEVTVSPDDLAAVADPVSDRAVPLEGFVNLADIDPRALGKVYDLAPDKTGDTAYRLLAAALTETGRAGVGAWTYRGAVRLVAVLPVDGRLIMREVAWPDEIAEHPAGDQLLDTAGTAELAAAVALIEALATEWDHTEHVDQRHQRTLAMLDELAAGHRPTPVPEVAATPDAVDDLMATLLASVEAARAAKAA